MTIFIIITYSIIAVLLTINYIYYALRGGHIHRRGISIYLTTFIWAPIFPILLTLFIIYSAQLYFFDGLLFLFSKYIKINLHTKYRYMIKPIQQIKSELIVADYKYDKLLSDNNTEVFHKNNLYITLNTFSIDLNYKNKSQSIFAYPKHNTRSAISKLLED